MGSMVYANQKEEIKRLREKDCQNWSFNQRTSLSIFFFFKVDELERYLDPSYGETPELSDDVKLDLVLAQEEKIYSNLELLNKVNALKKSLDSQEIAGKKKLFLVDKFL